MESFFEISIVAWLSKNLYGSHPVVLLTKFLVRGNKKDN